MKNKEKSTKMWLKLISKTIDKYRSSGHICAADMKFFEPKHVLYIIGYLGDIALGHMGY